ncbi:MAG: ankyrin repeat domain-containing protein, partial [Myxococcales bacterium]
MDQTARFFEAIKAGDVAAVNALLDAHPPLLSARPAEAPSPLLLALYFQQPGVRDALLARAPPRDVFEAAAVGALDALAGSAAGEWSADGFTALHLACFFGQPAAVAALLEQGADLNAVARNGSQLRPLHSALAHRGDEAAERIVRALLARGASVDVAQRGGVRPVHQAAARGSRV